MARISDEPIRISFVALHVSDIFQGANGKKQIGGAEVQQYLLAEELVKKGLEVSIIVKDRPRLRMKEIKGIQLITAYTPGRGLRFIRFIYPQMIKLWGALKKANADIYYVRGAKAETGIVALYCALRKKRLVQAMAHDNDCSWETLGALRWGFKRSLYLYGLRRADLVVAQTRYQQTLLAENFYVDSMVMHNVVTTRGVQKRDHSGWIEKLLWVGSVKPSKRPEVIIDVARRFEDIAFTMIASKDPLHEKYYQEIKGQADTVSNLNFVEYVPFHEIGRFFSETDGVLVSSQSEGFPNVILQAWAYGRPVISAFDPDGVILREDLGYVAKTVDDFAQAITELTQEGGKERIKMISKRCAVYVAQAHDVCQVVVQLLQGIAACAPEIKGPISDMVAADVNKIRSFE